MSDMTPLDDAAGLERVTATLRRLPATDAGAADRIVAAALRRQRDARRRRVWLATAASLLLAAGIGAGATVAYQRGASEQTATALATPATTPEATPAVDAQAFAGSAQLASAGRAEEALVSTLFVLRRPSARRVALVGDFDAWSPTAIPMTRGPDGTWTVSVALTPGRHTYAFVVDDSVWVTDPRSETVPDPDYGRPHSVIIVGWP